MDRVYGVVYSGRVANDGGRLQWRHSINGTASTRWSRDNGAGQRGIVRPPDVECPARLAWVVPLPPSMYYRHCRHPQSPAVAIYHRHRFPVTDRHVDRRRFLGISCGYLLIFSCTYGKIVGSRLASINQSLFNCIQRSLKS